MGQMGHDGSGPIQVFGKINSGLEKKFLIEISLTLKNFCATMKLLGKTQTRGNLAAQSHGSTVT